MKIKIFNLHFSFFPELQPKTVLFIAVSCFQIAQKLFLSCPIDEAGQGLNPSMHTFWGGGGGGGGILWSPSRGHVSLAAYYMDAIFELVAH